MKTDKELYPIFSVDVCTQDFSMEYVLIGAIDVDDLLKHMRRILKKMDKSRDEINMLMDVYKDYPPEPVEGAYTDNPYVQLTYFGYFE